MRQHLTSISECVHFWANKVQPSGQAASVFFEGDTLYSYGKHFAIARHLPNGAVAFATSRYSVTTSAHIGKARYAASHLRLVYCDSPSACAAVNKSATRSAIESALLASHKPRIRQKTRDGHKSEALRLALEFNEYLSALPDDERAGVDSFDTSALDDMRDALAVEAAKRAAIEAERARRAALDAAELLAEWREGIGRAPWGAAMALRIKGDSVETGKGASIPVADALKLWPIILRVKNGTGDFTPREPLGDYQLTKIRANGSIVVGCHDIPFVELEKMAKLLELI